MTRKIQIYTTDEHDEFGICLEGDAFMRHWTASGIHYPHLIDSFVYNERDTPDEILDEWVERHRP